MRNLVHAPIVVFAAEDDQARVDRLIQQATAALAGFAALLRSGQITKQQFIERASAELTHLAQQAGRVTAGSALDADVIDALVAGKSDYLDGFADDIKSGKASEAQIGARSQLWGGLIHTASQMARGHEAESRRHEGMVTEITWECVEDTHSCVSCEALAGGSPYSFDTLPTYPGEDVECGGNCRCTLHFEHVPASEAEFARLVTLPPAESREVVIAGGRI